MQPQDQHSTPFAPPLPVKNSGYARGCGRNRSRFDHGTIPTFVGTNTTNLIHDAWCPPKRKSVDSNQVPSKCKPVESNQAPPTASL